MAETEKPPTIKPRRPVPPRPNQNQLAKLGLVENETSKCTFGPIRKKVKLSADKKEMDPLHYLLNGEQNSPENDKINDACEKSEKVLEEKTTVEPLIDFSTAHENAKKIILEEPAMIESQNEMLERIGIFV